ncbi:AAA family ATPase [Aureimonas glaciei]|uniref:AAA+ ATPase domain-containing protein n=1 Tax=Aureimonas glaciei TaxID=1776957 RepID=A0A917DIE4_9HYPH|nr:AAA family ATPase [Aureimonas glaciei]GGD38363.1 hypothetical protein GCM10011335_46390 [Aureimonas glaciei]
MSLKDSKATRAWSNRHKSSEERVKAVADRLELNADLSLGAESREHFPTYNELWTGVSLFGGSMDEDAKQLLRIVVAEDQDHTVPIRDAIQTFILQPNKMTARSIISISARSQDVQNRARFYAAALGDLHAADDVNISHWPPCDEALLTVLIEGIGRAFHDGSADQPGSDWQNIALHMGISAIDQTAKHASHVEAALALVVERREQAETLARILEQNGEDPGAAAVNSDDVLFDELNELHEAEFGHLQDRGASEEYQDTPEFREGLKASMIERLAEIAARNRIPTKLVLHKSEKTYGADRKDFMRMFEPIAGIELPLVIAEFPHEIMLDLIDAWPHAADVIQEIFRDIKPDEPLRLPTVILVGAPGSGKTTLLTEIVRSFSLPSIVYPCATISDSSFGGTPAQWSTRRGSTPLDLIRQSKVANPAIILDELEKTGSSNHNGSLVFALLPMLEQHTARAYFEVGLETPSDLSAVSFLATANSLELPAPLKDRFRVLTMPDAKPEHVQVLSRRMIRQIEIGRGLDPGWIAPLDGDEIEVIQKAWGGGSLRKLKSAIQVTVDVRDKYRSMN